MVSPKEKIDLFFLKYPKQILSKKEILLQAQDIPEYAYLIINGKIRQFDITSTGSETTLNIFKPGALISISWILGDATTNYYYDAFEQTTVRYAPIAAVKNMIEVNPDVALDILTRVARGHEGLMLRMSSILSKDPMIRVMSEILLEARRFYEIKSLTVNDMKMAVDDIASRSGLTRETVSRQLTILNKTGLIIRSGRNISIPNIAMLEAAIVSPSKKNLNK